MYKVLLHLSWELSCNSWHGVTPQMQRAFPGCIMEIYISNIAIRDKTQARFSKRLDSISNLAVSCASAWGFCYCTTGRPFNLVSFSGNRCSPSIFKLCGNTHKSWKRIISNTIVFPTSKNHLRRLRGTACLLLPANISLNLKEKQSSFVAKNSTGGIQSICHLSSGSTVRAFHPIRHCQLSVMEWTRWQKGWRTEQLS